ncbi:hypothetical protein [Teredinibacter turnerae]|uniref:hypothetical protein n=1 Tax=Teredinibacter turnerae TaxID=2426 RepID=UPI0030CC63F4
MKFPCKMVSAICLFFISFDALCGTLVMTTPISGGRWGNQAPGTHPTYMYARSVDVYVPLDQGTAHAVRLSSYSHYAYDDGFYFKVDWIGASCNTGNAGTSIKFKIYNSSNTLVGYVAYSHLNNVPASITQGAILYWWEQPIIGYTKKWSNGACWSISGDNATHVHMEWQAGNYAVSEYVYQAYQPIDWGVMSFSKYD